LLDNQGPLALVRTATMTKGEKKKATYPERKKRLKPASNTYRDIYTDEGGCPLIIKQAVKTFYELAPLPTLAGRGGSVRRSWNERLSQFSKNNPLSKPYTSGSISWVMERV